MTCKNISSRDIVQSGKASHKGKVRPLNEDSLLIYEYRFSKNSEDIFIGLYAVADGVGGHDDGEIASQIALKILSENIICSLILSGLFSISNSLDKESLMTQLSKAVLAANREVFSQGQCKSNGMGTTLTAMLIVGSNVYIANVGDSRLYLLRNESLRQLTKDHSLVADLVTAGEIKKDEIYTHPQRNVITHCLGMRQELEADLYTDILNPDDTFLLCSDGLWEMVRDDKINEVMREFPNPQSACEQLIEFANQNGGVDNVSVIIVKATQ